MKIELRVGKKTYEMLRGLASSGIYGRDVSDVAVRIIESRLQILEKLDCNCRKLEKIKVKESP